MKNRDHHQEQDSPLWGWGQPVWPICGEGLSIPPWTALWAHKGPVFHAPRLGTSCLLCLRCLIQCPRWHPSYPSQRAQRKCPFLSEIFLDSFFPYPSSQLQWNDLASLKSGHHLCPPLAGVSTFIGAYTVSSPSADSQLILLQHILYTHSKSVSANDDDVNPILASKGAGSCEGSERGLWRAARHASLHWKAVFSLLRNMKHFTHTQALNSNKPQFCVSSGVNISWKPNDYKKPK